jgi:protein phosphatase PTC7
VKGQTSKRGLRFHYGVGNIPHDEKKHKGGEDAWVATS